MVGLEEGKVKLAIVVAEFNYDITEMMLRKAISHAEFLGAEVRYVFRVPGVFDAPYAVAELIRRDDVDAVAVIGAVIKGETRHDELVAHQAARKMLDLGIEHGKPVALGVIGPGATRMQAQARIEEYARRAIEAAIKMAKRISKSRRVKFEGKTVFIE